uniref:Uncharacterized protein n=1 Tax=Oncorhynchus kisutch TaxID=8019 RepID=A0A8C7DDF7_ONCKI
WEHKDDDGNFTNWMSSYWGHGAREGGNRTSERKRSFRRPARPQTDRRASLPCMCFPDVFPGSISKWYRIGATIMF